MTTAPGIEEDRGAIRLSLTGLATGLFAGGAVVSFASWHGPFLARWVGATLLAVAAVLCAAMLALAPTWTRRRR